MIGTVRTGTAGSFILCCTCSAGFAALFLSFNKRNPEIYLENTGRLKLITTYMDIAIQCQCYPWIFIYIYISSAVSDSSGRKFYSMHWIGDTAKGCLIAALCSWKWLPFNLLLDARNNLAQNYFTLTVEQALFLLLTMGQQRLRVTVWCEAALQAALPWPLPWVV